MFSFGTKKDRRCLFFVLHPDYPLISFQKVSLLCVLGQTGSVQIGKSKEFFLRRHEAVRQSFPKMAKVAIGGVCWTKSEPISSGKRTEPPRRRSLTLAPTKKVLSGLVLRRIKEKTQRRVFINIAFCGERLFFQITAHN